MTFIKREKNSPIVTNCYKNMKWFGDSYYLPFAEIQKV